MILPNQGSRTVALKHLVFLSGRVLVGLRIPKACTSEILGKVQPSEARRVSTTSHTFSLCILELLTVGEEADRQVSSNLHG